MIKSIRHIRGSESEWASHDIVIPDGEIAILKTSAGNTRLKVGNGSDVFSVLPSLLGDSVSSSADSITLLHAKSYRLGEKASLTLSLPSRVDDDYYSEISFDSGIDATELSINGTIRLSGDDVADEELMPRPNIHYTVFVWYDGAFQGVVRGIPNA